MPNIAIVWDFDGTLTPHDSTTKLAEILGAGTGTAFWENVHKLRDGDTPREKNLDWQHLLASDAPVWMYAMSRLAFEKNIPLNAQFFGKFVIPHITLYPKVAAFLRKLKLLEESKLFKPLGIKIEFFVVTAGLKELVEQAFPPDLIKWTFGCQYRINAYKGDPKQPESIPVFCMDETMKTRSLFEISKGSFANQDMGVNTRVPIEKRWAPFPNMIYIGDGDTDVPALSLVRAQGGMGAVVYDPHKPKPVVTEKLKKMCLEERADLITPANFDANSELFRFLEFRCTQIALRYRASQPI